MGGRPYEVMPLVDDTYPEERGACQAWKDWLRDPCFDKVRLRMFGTPADACARVAPEPGVSSRTPME